MSDEKKPNIGAKGSNLIKLNLLGFTPGFLVVDSSIFKKVLSYNKISLPTNISPDNADKYKKIIENIKIPKDVCQKINFKLKELGLKGLLIIRSCGKKEDSKYSFAGMYDSYQNVLFEDVLNYMKKCWASSFNERIIKYSNKINANLDYSEIGVVIQEMIKPEIKGHIYTSLKNKELVHIESFIKKEEFIQNESTYVLGNWIKSSNQLQEYYNEIIKKCKIIEEEFYTNADIEFVISNKKLSIVQVRKISKDIPYNLIPFPLTPPRNFEQDIFIKSFEEVFKDIFMINRNNLEIISYSGGKIFYNFNLIIGLIKERNLDKQEIYIKNIRNFFNESKEKNNAGLKFFIKKTIINNILSHRGIYFLNNLKKKYPSFYEEIWNSPMSFSTKIFSEKLKNEPELYKKLMNSSDKHKRHLKALLKKVKKEDLEEIYLCQGLAWLKDYLNFMDEVIPSKEYPDWKRTKITQIKKQYMFRDITINQKDFEGYVKIVEKYQVLSEIIDMKNANYILVVRDVYPSYLPIMLGCKGVISEVGGITSHTALLARELDIPFIAGVKDILKKVKDGDYLKVIKGEIFLENNGISKKI